MPACNVERLDALTFPDRAECIRHIARYLWAADNVMGQTVIDCACGTGYGSFILAQNHPTKRILGIDISAEAVGYAEGRYKAQNLSFQVGDIHDLPNADTIVSLETIEHIRDWEDAFQALFPRCSLVIFSTPWKQPCTPQSKQFHRAFGFCETSFEDIIPQGWTAEHYVQDAHGRIGTLQEIEEGSRCFLLGKIRKLMEDRAS